jgi:hypothetical protein
MTASVLRARLPARATLLALLAGASLLSACAVVAPPDRPAHRAAPAPAPVVPASMAAPRLYFYPERGQTEERQDRDRYECYQWATEQTRYDPGMTPLSRSEARSARGDGSGAVGGAITGAAIGAMVTPGRGGEGMVFGAILGAVLGSAREDAQAQARADWRADNRSRAQMAEFSRAMSACMRGRGYTVG